MKRIACLIGVSACMFSCVYCKTFMLGLERVKDKVDNALKSAQNISVQDFFASGKIHVDHIGELEKKWAGFYWAKQHDFCKKLQDLTVQAKDQAVTFLRTTTNEKYPQERNPFLTFAHNLHQEEVMLPELTADILRALDDHKKSAHKNEKDSTRLKTLFDDVAKGALTVKALMTAVDKLLG